MSMHKTTRIYTLEAYMSVSELKHINKNKTKHAKTITKTKAIATIMQIFRALKVQEPSPKPAQEPSQRLGKVDKKPKREKDHHCWNYSKASKHLN